MYVFGSGNAYATPYGASAPGSPSPLELGVLQETGIEFATSQKELYGKQQFPLAVARTAGKVNLTFKFANGYAKLWNDLFFGSTIAAGEEIGVADEQDTPSTNVVTVAPPNTGTFSRNLGVRDATTGKQMTLVPSAPASGVSYTVAGAVFTFGSGQGDVLISYTYTLGTGFKSAVVNKPMGSQPVMDITIFNAQYVNLDNAVNVLLRFPAVIAGKMGMPMKNEDWMITEFACGAFSDASGHILYINADE